MNNDSTLYVGLDVHKESMTVAYAINGGEVELIGRIGTTSTDIDRLCKWLQSKARQVRVVYEAGPSRRLYTTLYDYLTRVKATQNRVGGGVAPAVLPHTWTPPFCQAFVDDGSMIEIAAIHPDCCEARYAASVPDGIS